MGIVKLYTFLTFLENTDSKLLSKLIEKLKINRETEINTVLMGERQNDEI